MLWLVVLFAIVFRSDVAMERFCAWLRRRLADFKANLANLADTLGDEYESYGVQSACNLLLLPLPLPVSSLRHERSSNKRAYAQFPVRFVIGDPICKDPCSIVAPLPRIPMVQRCCGNVRARRVLW